MSSILDKYLINFESYREAGQLLIALRIFDKETKKIVVSCVSPIDELIDTDIGFLPSVSISKCIDMFNSCVLDLDKEQPICFNLVRWKDGATVIMDKELGFK